MNRIIALVLVVLFSFCSCTNSETASKAESNNSTDSLNTSIQPWAVDFYTNDFKYSSIDEFCEEINKNGSDELFECIQEVYYKPDNFDSKRRENISRIIDNCVYETYYKGIKLEINELVGFNIHLGNEHHSSTGYPSYCEYFVKFSDDPVKGDCVVFVRFYEMSRIQKEWNAFVEAYDSGEYEPEMPVYSLVRISYNGKEKTECIINGTRDPETGVWTHETRTQLYLKLNDDVVVFIDFAPGDMINSYAKKIYLEGCSPLQSEKRIKEELAIYDVPPVDDSNFLDNLQNYLTFEEVDVQIS